MIWFGLGKKNPKFFPKDCGPFVINAGAIAQEIDEFGELVLDINSTPNVVAGPTDQLILVAVKDLDSGGIVGDGSGDEDADGLIDAIEALSVGTDPCNPDTDGDGLLDGADPNPLTFN